MKNFSLTSERPLHRDSASRACRAARFSKGAFTLVEVTLAIGIISFAFVAMFGMLPVGLNVSRQAMDTTIEAQIVQQMKTQALQTDFSMLGTLSDAADVYFDDQGKQVEQSAGLYRAGFSSVSEDTLLPDGTPNGTVTRQLKNVTIFIENTKGAAQSANSKEPKKFTILIPNNGL
jgi:uncharacterized protein (TIGR02598 family)